MDKKLFAIIIGIWVCTTVRAYDFRVWDVCFNLHENNEVSVTAGDRTTGGSRDFFITPYCLCPVQWQV